MSGNMIVACEYCGREMPDAQLVMHERVCIVNPDVEQATREYLAVLSEDGFMPTAAEFDGARAMYEDIPNAFTLRHSLGLTWEGVARWAGLRPESERLDYSLEQIKVMAEERHANGVGPSMSEWRTHRPSGTYLAESITRIFGSWGKVLSHLGLVEESRGYYIMHSKRMRDGSDERMAEYIEGQRRALSSDDYPLLPGVWKQKQYALWPSGRQHTGMVYELR